MHLECVFLRDNFLGKYGLDNFLIDLQVKSLYPLEFKDPFSLTVMHRGRFGLSWTTKIAIRVSSFSGGEICFHLNSLFML